MCVCARVSTEFRILFFVEVFGFFHDFLATSSLVNVVLVSGSFIATTIPYSLLSYDDDED